MECVFISNLQVYIKAEPMNAPIVTETRALAISALATLAYPSLKLTLVPRCFGRSELTYYSLWY